MNFFRKNCTIIYRGFMTFLLFAFCLFLLHKLTLDPVFGHMLVSLELTDEMLFGSIVSIFSFSFFFAFYHFVCLVDDIIQRIVKRINGPKP